VQIRQHIPVQKQLALDQLNRFVTLFSSLFLDDKYVRPWDENRGCSLIRGQMQIESSAKTLHYRLAHGRLARWLVSPTMQGCRHRTSAPP